MITFQLLKSLIVNNLQIELISQVKILEQNLSRVHRKMIQLFQNHQVFIDKPLNLIISNKPVKIRKILKTLQLIKLNSQYNLPLLNPI
jgi:hypothetical protein